MRSWRRTRSSAVPSSRKRPRASRWFSAYLTAFAIGVSSSTLSACTSHHAGKILNHPIGIQILRVLVQGGHGDGGRIQDRHPGIGIVDMDLVQIQFCNICRKTVFFAGACHQHETARCQVTAVSVVMVVGTGLVERDNGWVAIAFLEHGSRAPRGVIAKRLFRLQYRDAAELRQPCGGADPCDAAADDDKITHAEIPSSCSSSRSVAGAGRGLSAEIRA